MVGKPDEGGYFANINELLSWSESEKDWIFLMDLDNSDPNSSDVKDEMRRLYEDRWDTEADRFYFNYPGGSGKFQFAPDQSVIMLPANNTKVTPNMVLDASGENDINSTINSFELKR